jgi:thiamine kinase-like enzyme
MTHKQRLDLATNSIITLFGETQILAIEELQGGSASSVYQITLPDKDIVLRIMDLEEDLSLRQNQINCYLIAAKMNIAPKCYFADAQSGIIVMEYVQAQSTIVSRQWLTHIAKLLHHIHSVKDFPLPHRQLFDYMDDLIGQLRAEELAPRLTAYFVEYARIRDILKLGLLRASCHNDLNSKNILFDGKNTYLIDWEAAGLEDPFFDLATICNEYIFQDTALKELFLTAYFGRSPTQQEQAKVYLMQQISHCYLAIHYLLHARNAGLKLDNGTASANAMTMKDWEIGYLSGKFTLDTPYDFLKYALTHISESYADMAKDYYQFALTRMAGIQEF